MRTAVTPPLVLLTLAAALFCSAAPADAQTSVQRKWLAGGSFHNWYAEAGNECEECGFVRTMQDGWRWPGIYQRTDMQVSKALWIGAQDVTGPEGTQWPVRVVHAGPRVSGAGEFFPVRFELVARRPNTVVVVDGDESFSDTEMVVDRVDPSIPADFVLFNEVNTLLGITMERRVLQFSLGYHDDYHVLEYTFTNTGDAGPAGTVPPQTLEGVYFFFQHRLALTKEARYAIGNPTGWGKNTMIDRRGDGVEADPPDERFRAAFTWHGLHPPFARYPGGGDNLGAPLMPPAVPAPFVAFADSIGRFSASQFAGVVTLHADASASDPADDPAQPSTTTWVSADARYQSINDPSNAAWTREEYDLMASGHRAPRHARAVEPSGLPGFLAPTNDPSFGTSGGYVMANGYGPYTLAPGESVRIVVAEGAAGLSREANEELGRQFKAAGGSGTAPLTYTVHGQERTMTKNEWVFTGRDSLFQTFRRAIANHEAGYVIPEAPAPPALLSVRSGADRIQLDWEVHVGEPPPVAYEVYRARGAYDSTYVLAHTATPAERSFEDVGVDPGADYYYYIVAVGDASANTGGGGTPAGQRLRSSRYGTQTYRPARLSPTSSGEPGSGVRGPFRLRATYPNPFAARTAIAFDLPLAAAVTLTVYDVRGAVVARLAEGAAYPAGSHEVVWEAAGRPSGVYFIRASAGGTTTSLRVSLVR